jgi:S1-C subfamily serine protease
VRLALSISKEFKRDRWQFAGGFLLISVVLSCSSMADRRAHANSLLEGVFRQTEKNVLAKGSIAVGSGAFVSRTAVLTSAHVIAGCRSFAVENPKIGQVFARVAQIDTRQDAAILLINTGQSQDYLGAVGPSTERRFRIFGYASSMPAYISAAAYQTRSVQTSDDEYMVLDTDVPPGMSGGPIVDMSGRIAAIITGKMNAQHSRTIGAQISEFKASMFRYFAGVSVGQAINSVVKVRCNR